MLWLEKRGYAALLDVSTLEEVKPSFVGFRLAAGAVGRDPWSGDKDADYENVKFRDLNDDGDRILPAAA